MAFAQGERGPKSLGHRVLRSPHLDGDSRIAALDMMRAAWARYSLQKDGTGISVPHQMSVGTLPVKHVNDISSRIDAYMRHALAQLTARACEATATASEYA